ncbi:hypothetical protein [Bacillus cereus]|uniref:HTH arsR-type domain-containing protein n=1 Tax=Bacillus cereus VD184 TaxID=1053242 RepID=A0A9W5R265_BACCE|nr:hypothetical protein [Bacillus cereus]EOQ04830.1 hypothetical protein IKC_06414 [Bacillus cereus VD184]
MFKIVNMDLNDYEASPDILRVLAHPMRLRIVKKMIEMGSLNVFQIGARQHRHQAKEKEMPSNRKNRGISFYISNSISLFMQ